MLTDLLTIPLEGPVARSDASLRACAPPCEFLAGPENALVVAAATEFENQPPASPLVLYGPAGVGKTLLAWGLADRWRAVHPEDRVYVTSGHDFARDFAQAVSADAADDFARQQRKCRLLVIDDLEELAGKNAAQESLLHTLNALDRRGAVVIATLHACPGEGTKLSPQLVSRLLAGLVIPLVPATAGVRKKIAEHLAAQLGVCLDAAAAQWLEAHPEAPLAKLRFLVQQLAQRDSAGGDAAISALLSEENSAPSTAPTVAQITSVVAKQFHLPQAVLKGASRRATTILARGLAMLAARRYCQLSYQEIGRHFGRRDHTTVLHACRKLENSLKTDPLTAAAWRQVLLELNVPGDEL